MPDLDLKPVLIPHHKGRKRLHLGMGIYNKDLNPAECEFPDQKLHCIMLQEGLTRGVCCLLQS